MKSYFSGFLTQPEVQNHTSHRHITKVAVIIDGHHKFNSLCSLLEDISKQKLYQTKIDIYIVDQDSSHRTQAYLQKFNFAAIKVIKPSKNLCKSKSYYYGLQFVSKLKYDYIWLLDHDVHLDPLALSTLINTLQDHDEVGLVASKIYQRKNSHTLEEIDKLMNGDHAPSKTQLGNQNNIIREELLYSKPYIKVENCANKSILLRHQVVQRIGIFKDFWFQFEDVDLCVKVKKAGWILALNPSSIVWQNLPDLESCTWIDYYNECNLYYWQKYRPDLL